MIGKHTERRAAVFNIRKAQKTGNEIKWSVSFKIYYSEPLGKLI